MNAEIKKWIEKDGVKFLREIGIKKGQTVLDFGCGEGHYTIPAAKIAGKSGRVYAMDKNRQILAKMIKIAKAENLNNIDPIITKKGAKIPLSDEFIDTALVYDVLHSSYFELDSRKRLLGEIYRITRRSALISVYPKHMEQEGIIEEMKEMDFYLVKKIFKQLIHNKDYEKDYVLNFSKK